MLLVHNCYFSYIYATSCYGNWPRYGLRWSGAGRGDRKRPRRPAPLVLCWSASTNQSSADRMSGQFLVYHANEAIDCDKCSEDELSCWNVPDWQRHWDENVHRNSVRVIVQYDVTIASGSCIDDVTITHLFSFEIVSSDKEWTVWFSFI